ncbi:MAG: hypothetical protein J6S45_06945 [Firmicutes bacterium]|nr:hypothetical protein [Bacillota bacterium]
MRYFLAIDAGGTKTDAVVFDETGHIIYRDLSAGNNGMDIGQEAAIQRLLDVLERTSKAAPEKFTAMYGGIAGVMPLGDFYSPAVLPKNYADSVRFEDDGRALISSTVDPSVDACGMVCGTGCSLYVRQTGEPLRKIGGKGYLIDTGGSGFELGRDAIAAAFRYAERRTGHTVLYDLIREQMGCEPEFWQRAIYHPVTGGRAYIASFARYVFEAYRMGDWAARELFDKGSSAMADLTFAAATYFKEEFPVVMSGGMVTNFPEYAHAIQAKSHVNAKLILADAPPVYGAAVEALADGGLTADASFRTTFLTDYDLWVAKSSK